MIEIFLIYRVLYDIVLLLLPDRAERVKKIRTVQVSKSNAINMLQSKNHKK